MTDTRPFDPTLFDDAVIDPETAALTPRISIRATGRFRIDTRKWLMSKLGPRRYGDRLLVAGEPENPIRVLHEQVSHDRLTREQLDTLESFATAMSQRQRESA